MAALKKRKGQINLLPQEEFAASVKGRVLSWTLSTFRVIVIVTEILVMSAFLSRFWLDARVADLNDLLDQKVAIVASVKGFEEEFRRVQKKADIISYVSTQGLQIASTIQTMVNSIPNDVYLSSIALSKKDLRIGAISSTEIGVAQMMVNLEDLEPFEKVSLTQLDTSDNGALLLFDLKVGLGGGK